MSGERVREKQFHTLNVVLSSSSYIILKDTVFVPLWVSGGSWHVEQHEPGVVRFVDDDFVELDSGVHPSDVGVVPGRKERCVYGL